ncbi:MAG: radical SAM protein [Thermoplasmata archaeon]|nr:radical SAM protein [Thermoplasmata archaeon]
MSVTGEKCALKCKHCGARFLRGMVSCRSNEDLISIGEKLVNEGSRGFLLSGGCDKNGRVPLWDVLEGVHKLKLYTPLKINAHTGLVFTKDLAELYAASGIDVFSVDVVGSDRTIKEIYGMDVTVKDYEKTVANLADVKVPVVPHITIGIDHGRPSGEEAGIDLVAGYSLPKLVLNVLVPVSGTPLEGVHVTPERIENVFRYARERMHGEIMLGCMRPRDLEIEKFAWKYDFSGVAHPSREFVEFLEKSGEKIEFRNGCCSLF